MFLTIRVRWRGDSNDYYVVSIYADEEWGLALDTFWQKERKFTDVQMHVFGNDDQDSVLLMDTQTGKYW